MHGCFGLFPPDSRELICSYFLTAHTIDHHTILAEYNLVIAAFFTKFAFADCIKRIYIPRKPGMRHPWGQGTDYKNELGFRNECIRKDYADGVSIATLVRKYHLSKKSIRRILKNR